MLKLQNGYLEKNKSKVLVNHSIQKTLHGINIL